MNLKNILVGIENLKVKGSLDIDILGLKNNSQDVKENDMFVAIKGFKSNGHEHIEEAIKNGALDFVIKPFDKKAIEDSMSKLKNIKQ